MNVLDCFAGGAGGFSLGLHRAGFRTVAACEIDPWRRDCFARNFPGVKMYGDIRDVSAAVLARDGICPIHVVAGSPPCQDASTANTKGCGVDGERTGLFFELVRLVGELRPRFVVAENVPGIRTRGVDRVLAALEREGYAVGALVVGAVHAGAPHLRKRVWIIAHANGGRSGADLSGIQRRKPNAEGRATPDPHSSVIREADGTRSSRRQARRVSQGHARDPLGPRLEIGQGERGDPCEEQPSAIGAILQGWSHWNGGPPDLGRVDARLPKGVARAALAAYGDSVVPQIVEALGRAILKVERCRPAA